MESINERKRQVDLEKLDIENLDAIGEKLGNRVNVILKDALQNCNKILNIYGLEIVFGYELKETKKD